MHGKEDQDNIENVTCMTILSFMTHPQGVPKSGEGFIDFIGQVHKTKEQFGQEGPITVHCSAGVGRTGVFVSLSIVLERMRYGTRIVLV